MGGSAEASREAADRGRQRAWLVAMVLALVGGIAAQPEASCAQGLFVVSRGNQKVLHYDQNDGSFVGTFVEPITEGFRNPGGMAIRPSDGVLYVSSTGTGELWKYTTSSGQVITPEVASGLISPGGIGFDATGANLYFLAAETELSTGTDALMKLEISSGSVSTLASDGSANFRAVAVNGSDLYLSDSLNGRIVRYSTSGGSGSTLITGLSSPGSMLLRSPTDLLVADTGTDRVLEYSFDGMSWSFDREVLQASAGVNGPLGLALAPDGRIMPR
jgi:DNA-binding beta-propeller fold protein YncE